jgi:phage anti-repressor protein
MNEMMEMQTSSNLPLATMQMDGDYVQTVNARDLHNFLKVGKMFAHWIKDRIEQYNFLENQDFIVFADFGKNPQGGRPSKEYHLTLDMAKELSMVERNAQGKIARQYFIKCEKMAKEAAHAAPGIIAWDNPLQVAGILQQAMQRVICLQDQLDNSTPRLDASYFPNGERPPMMTPAESTILLYQEIQRVEQEIVTRGYQGRLRDVVSSELGKSAGSIQRARRFGEAFFRLHKVNPEAAGKILIGHLRGAIGSLHKINGMKNSDAKKIGKKILFADKSTMISQLF